MTTENITKVIDYNLATDYQRLKEIITMFTSNNPDPKHNFINYVFHHNIENYVDLNIVRHLNDIQFYIEQYKNESTEEDYEKLILEKFDKIINEYTTLQTIYSKLTEPNRYSIKSLDEIPEIKDAFRNYDHKLNTEFKYPTLLSCFTSLETEIKKLQITSKQHLTYFEGKEKSILGQLKYWTVGWVAWTYNWCKYRTKINAYNSFETLYIDPLRTYLSSRNKDINTAKLHFKMMINNLNKCKKTLPYENSDADAVFKIEKIIREINNIQATTASIYSCLKCKNGEA